MSIFEKLQGTGVALVTPFNQDGSIDFDSYKKLIDYVIDGGCNYVVTLGTTGEAPVLDKDEKIKIINATYEYVDKRVPVVVGVGGNHTNSVLNDLGQLPLESAIAILSVSPYYSKPSQEGIYLHYKAVAEVSPKPVILYNVPGRTGRDVSVDTVVRLAREVPKIIGIKDASGDVGTGIRLLKYCPDSFMIISGDDPLAVSQIACGMSGVISVAANAFPHRFSEMITAALDNNFQKANKINADLLEAYDLMFCENNPAGIKAFLSELNLMDNHLRLPGVPLSASYHQKVKSFLAGNKSI
ncbi:MAG: 4-hydroxy-tetrahydrodipicolinate synthase [Bacteroidota bacterium]|jgi:4-hydroxy-tetrahydrodipicolinate synthase